MLDKKPAIKKEILQNTNISQNQKYWDGFRNLKKCINFLSMFASIFQCPDKQILSIADKNILKRIVFEDVYQIKVHEVYFWNKQRKKVLIKPSKCCED